MQQWRKKKSLMRAPKYVTVLDPMEREVLGNLASAVSEALIERVRSAPKDELAEMTGLSTGHKDAPEDPSLARLLPDFEREGDEEFEGDNSLLRSFHENDIVRAKLENLQVIVQALGPDGSVNVTLEENQVHSWLSAVNDLRLYVAAGVTGGAEHHDGMYGEAPGMAPESERLVEWLAYHQDSLLEAMMGER
ncbi:MULTISPECIES: DUF2017 domain-containing protein [unclassified Corynebacterium]|uniref:DUF2017 domain-containing protein n=1 Tax=unclassified Corynebacterium TaxID=2624378 RepID=UPI0029CA0ABF|nr:MULTISPECIES: DUF2017 domain-containing protein [unclassified Corynebacterium]WPF65718.1 DUF2017 domain-containing protein [Corynebacterium sp. 22KM0430]WPF68213.1 DUF2017 domain-containing protein [Corynebacterium sp. 21KM1197]